MKNRYEVAWYHLRAKRFNLLISAQTDITGRKFLTTYNQNRTRLNITADTWITRATLVISGVTESDAGLYFCGTKSDKPQMFFDKPIRLEIEGRHAEDQCTGNRFQFDSYTFMKLSVKGGMGKMSQHIYIMLYKFVCLSQSIFRSQAYTTNKMFGFLDL